MKFHFRRVSPALLLPLLLTACAAKDSPPGPPVPILTAPPATAFVLQVGAAHYRLEPQILLTATPEGVLSNTNGLPLWPTVTVSSEARVLRIAANGAILQRLSQSEQYMPIGQIRLARLQTGAPPVEPVVLSDMQLGIPGSPNFGSMTPAVYAVTRQGTQIGLVPINFGG